MGFRLARDFGRQATTLLCLWVSVGGVATCNAARLTMEVPLDAVAFRGMVGGRPLGLQSSVAGDINPRDAGRPVRWVAAQGWCAPEHGTRRRERGTMIYFPVTIEILFKRPISPINKITFCLFNQKESFRLFSCTGISQGQRDFLHNKVLVIGFQIHKNPISPFVIQKF